ncbi:hypothetical protein CORC01_03509 [Colletotrichum orchidophilum]|uniref:Uncharacterized protein n=1 Tax=Colletotrichum orchidophilum TaxID=1209926 RepID=A0A1G4BIE8_9PEZI|nr:uncharacterized protein CORC01_03509 [Colletotrichum orchidophilum]OHF01194.1 hypothetical protein CORC01_03509 [Colletotrichum orchidophilum]
MPMANRKFAARHLPQWHHQILLDDSSIQPTGNGHEFSFTPSNRFAQLSPRTSSEDSESDEEEESESGSESEQDFVPQAKPEEEDDDDEDEDSDDEEEEEDSDDEASEDEDDDTPMRFAPPAPPPMQAPMPAPMSASMFPPRPAPMPASRMAVRRSSEEDSNEDEEDEDAESESDSESESLVTPPIQEIRQEHHVVTVTATVKANFTLEELSDFDPMDQDRTGTIAPTGFSSPSSARSRSRAPPAPKGLPPGFTRGMGNLGVDESSSEDSDNDLDDDGAHAEFVRRQRALKMLNRRTHGSSIGKRTISERSGSDHEDMTPLDADAVGSSARRLRRRCGDSHRRSFIHLQFQDPPPPRIDELEEPESEVEGTFIFCDSGTLARELPYYSIEIMEYESSSPSPSP